jgi:outer membrane protein assembly factor BamB
MKRSWLAVLAFAALTPCASSSPNNAASNAWLQFGGPTRDFKLAGTRIAKAWPSGGPKALWSRALGDGYSSIVGDHQLLVTMYSPLKGMIATITSKLMTTEPEPEVVIALDPQTGKTLWEHRYPAPPVPKMDLEYGPGPQSTPLIAGDIVYSVGLTGKMFALDRKTGRVIWSHDLWQEFQGEVMGRGYSPSPLLYKDSIIVPLGGGSFQALAAFAPKDGKLLWKGGDVPLSPASPMLIEFAGQDQLILFNASGVSGHDPTNGRVLWSHPHKTDWGLNISTPVWGPDNRLFLSSAYGSGSRVLELTRDEAGKTVPKEIGYTGKMKVHFGTAVRVGDVVYGSSGDFGPAFFTAFDVKKSEILWQERGFSRASFVVADDRLVLVDEDGLLLLAEAGPKGLTIHGKVSALAHRAWTAPTLIGTRLYVRDRKTIRAFDIG